MLKWRWRWFAWGIAAVVLPFAALGSYIIAIQSHRNFDVVVAGQMYRSAQPMSSDLRQYVAQEHIGSVINLRGESKGAPWYDEEIATSSALGLKHYDFRMSASQSLSQAEAVDLIALLNRAEKPVLVHCNWGADRTGLAAALYLAAIAKKTEADAEAQLSLRFGHFSIPLLSQGYAMDETFEGLEPWLGYFGS